MSRVAIEILPGEIETFCRGHGVCRLALFGSVLRDDFSPESDVDVLVEFQPTVRVGLLGLAAMEIELSQLLGRTVDLNTPGFLSEHYRQDVLQSAEVQYEAA